MERIYIFLGLFSLVYFFEAIGGSYIISAIQSIERQYQIPSKISGMMVSASDIGYIPTVVFIAYFGSRGNRAKWIGSGAVLIAITYLAIASPNFIFPVIAPQPNITDIQKKLVPLQSQLSLKATLRELLIYPLIQDRIPSDMLRSLLNTKYIDDNNEISDLAMNWTTPSDNITYSYYSIDGDLLNEAMNSILDTFTRNASSYRVRQLLSLFIRRRSNREHSDLLRVRRSATAPFTYCSKLVNELRKIMGNMRCLEQADNKGLFFILLPALLLLGIGRTMPWSLGIPLVDDNVKKKNLPAYFAGMSFIRVLGPITGFLIGSFCNKLYYTLHPPVGLTPSDPTWIGAWWIGFICIGVLTLFPSVSLFLFSAEVKSGSRSDGQNNQINLFDNYKDHQENQRSIYERMTDFLHSYAKVLRTKIYIGSVFGRVCDVLAYKGYVVFLPKYLENHFGIPQFKVHRYMAMFGVFGFAFGTIIGGFLTCQYRLNGRKAAMFVLVVSTINMCLFFSKTFIWCESVVNSVGLNSRNNNYNFTRECNSECGCTGSHLYPVCDAKGYAFFSPCHAGCHEVKVNRVDSSDLEFSSCDCADGGVVRKNFCKDSCTFSTTIFFGTVLIGALFAGMGVVPGLLILLRSVPPETRSQSLGFQGLLVSLFGTLPSPILWGFVIDSSCLVWESSCINNNGNCAIYEPHRLRIRMHMMYTLIRIISMSTDIYVWFHAKNLNILEEVEKSDSEILDDVRKGSIHLNPLPIDGH